VLVFLGTFVILLQGRLFGGFCVNALTPEDVTSMQNDASVVQNEGFTKIRKVCFWMRLVCNYWVHVWRLWVTFSSLGSIFEENALH